MGKQLVDKMLPALNKVKMPANNTATVLGLKAYEEGVYQVDSSNNSPRKIADALRTFQTGDSQPYLCAGIAYALIAASREADNSYDQNGLQSALDWLEKAQDVAPDRVEINVSETLAYIHLGRLEDARLVLDYLGGQEPSNFYLARAEIVYWRMIGDAEQVEKWYEMADQRAPNGIVKMHLQLELADHLAETKQWERAIEAYRKPIHFNRDNPLPWHKLSLVYWEQNNLEEAERCNQRSLKLGKLPEAIQLMQAIKQKMAEEKGGLGKRLFGR